MSMITVSDVVEMLNVPRSWIYNKVHSKSLPFNHYKVGQYLRFERKDVETYLEAQRVRSGT